MRIIKILIDAFKKRFSKPICLGSGGGGGAYLGPLTGVVITSMSLGQPTYAGDWLVFRGGTDRTNEHWSGKAPPIAGASVPGGSIVKDWLIVNDDKKALNYRLDKGSVIHDPPPPPPPPDFTKEADVEGFIQAIWDDPDLIQVSTNLVVFKPLLKEYILTPERLQQAWARISAGLPGDAKTAIEAYAEQFRIPLVGK